jgi:riboflavin biosynthesis pyrimidine reductase
VRGVRDVARQPWRVVLTRGGGDLPAKSHVFTDQWRERTLVFRRRALGAVLRALGRKAVTSVLIEGGATVLNQAFRAGLVDEVQLYVTPWQSGAGATLLRMNNRLGRPVVLLPGTIQVERLGADVFLRAELQRAGLNPE